MKKTSTKKKITRPMKTVENEPLEEIIPDIDLEIVPKENEPQDRGEDLANIKDSFVHGPELDADNPPEMSQKWPNKTPKEKENLADRFDAERKSRPPF